MNYQTVCLAMKNSLMIKSLSDMVELADMRLLQAKDISEACRKCTSWRIDLLVIDYELAKGSLGGVLDWMFQYNEEMKIIILSDPNHFKVAEKASRKHSISYLGSRDMNVGTLFQ